MTIQEAITAFSQSDKIKSQLIMVSAYLDIWAGLPSSERQGAEKIIRAHLGMVGNEIVIGRKLCGDCASWQEAARLVDRALVMINSGIPQESTFHLSRALSQITGIAQQAMSFLKEQNLLR